MTGVDGFLLLRKPPDVTSFQALSPVKKLMPGTKVGHTGTLDRFAEGLLVVLCGRMTRLAPHLTGMDKEYEAELFFGMETSTLDPEGQVVGQGPVPERAAVEEAIKRFRGPIEQIPPQYSAVHVAGERAYRAARAGRTVEIAPRSVVIDRLELLDYAPPLARIAVVCSSGTYIRALTRDIGRASGSRAYVHRLLRSRVGPFTLSAAVSPEEIRLDRDLGGWHECFARLPRIREIEVRASNERAVLRGARIEDGAFVVPPVDDGELAVFDREGEFLALMERCDGKYRYQFVAPPGRH